MESASVWVLVVEDEPLVTSTLGYLLESRGHAFDTVGTLADATRALAARHYDAIILEKERQRRSAHVARASANLVLSVINDVLDFSPRSKPASSRSRGRGALAQSLRSRAHSRRHGVLSR